MFTLKYCSIVLIILTSISSVSAFDPGQDDDRKIFTNKDLEEYTKPTHTSNKTENEASQNTSTKELIHVRTRKQKNDEEYQKRIKKEKEERLQQYWCRKGSQYRRKVEKAEARVKDAEEYLSDVEHDSPSVSRNSCKLSGAENRLKRAQQLLREAEDDLSYIEDEAHRQWIPPGWLRCQF